MSTVQGGVNWRTDWWDFGRVVALAVEVLAADGRTVIRHAASTRGQKTIRPAGPATRVPIPEDELPARVIRAIKNVELNRIEYDSVTGQFWWIMPPEDPGEYRRKSDAEVEAELKPRMLEWLRAIVEAGEIVRGYLERAEKGGSHD